MGEVLLQASELTPFEQQLIRLLQVDGRAPFSRMAKELGVPEKQVRRCVEDLRARGVIHITAVTDPSLLGYGVISIVGIVVAPAANVRDVAAQIAALPGAFYVVVVAGRYNVVAEFHGESLDSLVEVINECAQMAGISSIHMLPYLKLHYRFPAFDAAAYKATGAKPGRRLPTGAEIVVTDLDRQIIESLSLDGRVAFRELARNLGISEAQVRRRVGRLTESGMLRVMALTVPSGIGYTTSAFCMVSLNPTYRASLAADEIAALPGVIYVAICAGDFDLMVEVVSVDPEDLLRFLDEEIRPLAFVARVETWLHLELHYRSLLPPRLTPVGESGAQR